MPGFLEAETDFNEQMTLSGNVSTVVDAVDDDDAVDVELPERCGVPGVGEVVPAR